MPKILLTPRYDYTNPDSLVLFNYPEYYTMIEDAGGKPFLGTIYTKEEAEKAAQEFDGLLITGGADVDTSLYDGGKTEEDANNAHFDRNDLYLYHAFRKAGKPIFGICRGIQIIGVAEGVKLIHDIPSEFNIEHNQMNLPDKGRYDTLHNVVFQKGTQLYDIFGEQHAVNSFHHQALRSLPKGFTLSAVSKKDGIIEAIDKENVLAVQWHPERLTKDLKHFALAQLFIKYCLLYKTR